MNSSMMKLVGALVVGAGFSSVAYGGDKIPAGLDSPTTFLSLGVDTSGQPSLGGGSGVVTISASPAPIILNADGTVTLPTGVKVPAASVISRDNQYGGITLQLDDGSVAVYDAQGNLKEVRAG